MNKKILIVDDSSLARTKIKNMLVDLGYSNITEASNGEEAIASFLTHRQFIITMDIEMPIMNGIEAIRELKNISSKIAVLWVSSNCNQQQIAEAK